MSVPRFAQACGYLDNGSNGVRVRFATLELHSKPMQVAHLIVAKQHRPAACLGQDHIQVSIAVNVRVGCTTPDDRACEIAGLRAGTST